MHYTLQILHFKASTFLLAVAIFVLHVTEIIIFIDYVTVKWIPCTVLASRAGEKRTATEYASAGIGFNYWTTVVLSSFPNNLVMHFGKVVDYKKKYRAPIRLVPGPYCFIFRWLTTIFREYKDPTFMVRLHNRVTQKRKLTNQNVNREQWAGSFLVVMAIGVCLIWTHYKGQIALENLTKTKSRKLNSFNILYYNTQLNAFCS